MQAVIRPQYSTRMTFRSPAAAKPSGCNSVAQVRAGGKYVRGFSDHVSIEHDAYVTLEQAVNDLLDQAVEGAKGDLSEDPNTKVPDPFAFAAREMETGA